MAPLKETGVVAERREVAVFVLHHTRMIANQDRSDQWQRRSKHTELDS
jgi:hypothetical protein